MWQHLLHERAEGNHNSVQIEDWKKPGFRPFPNWYEKKLILQGGVLSGGKIRTDSDKSAQSAARFTQRNLQHKELHSVLRQPVMKQCALHKTTQPLCTPLAAFLCLRWPTISQKFTIFVSTSCFSSKNNFGNDTTRRYNSSCWLLSLPGSCAERTNSSENFSHVNSEQSRVFPSNENTI